jgi:hypothetical protein
MTIHATAHACFLVLPNGLTLELFYDEALSGANTLASDPARDTSAWGAGSHGVWLLHEEVLFTVRAGQA